MQAKPRKHIAVIICARMWLEAEQKIRDWVIGHPNEQILDQTPIIFTEKYGGYSGGLMAETNEDWSLRDLEC